MSSSNDKVKYVRLGNSGLKVSKVIFGGMSIGSDQWDAWIKNEPEALPLLKHAYDAGINTWDTADVYSHGVSEQIIGKALKQYNIPRKNVVIMTKCYFGVMPESQTVSFAALMTNDGPMVNQIGLSRKHIFDAVDASVARLGTYIDVLQIHRLDRETPKEEIMKALNDVIESGKVRYIGASSMFAWEFQQLQNIAEKNGWHKFISMQNYHNLIYREEEREMIPYCKNTGVGLMPWSPIARGVLARPFDSRDTLREKTDHATKFLVRNKDHDADKAIIDRVEEVAKKHGVSMACIATAWCITKGEIPVIGMSTNQRIDEAVKNSNFVLPEEDMKYLEEPYFPKRVVGITA